MLDVISSHVCLCRLPAFGISWCLQYDHRTSSLGASAEGEVSIPDHLDFLNYSVIPSPFPCKTVCVLFTGQQIIRYMWPLLHQQEMRPPAMWPGVTALWLILGKCFLSYSLQVMHTLEQIIMVWYLCLLSLQGGGNYQSWVRGICCIC